MGGTGTLCDGLPLELDRASARRPCPCQLHVPCLLSLRFAHPEPIPPHSYECRYWKEECFGLDGESKTAPPHEAQWLLPTSPSSPPLLSSPRLLTSPPAATTIIDKAIELNHVGGTFAGNIQVTPFLCLVLKMLQIQPDAEVIKEYVLNEDFK